MDIRHLDRPNMAHENGAETQRLLPWPELNAPFEACWAVVRPGAASGLHAHHEHEIFIALSGSAVVECAGERQPFNPGDIVRFPPFSEHRVINEGTDDFEMYSVWWDADMAERFTKRLEQEG